MPFFGWIRDLFGIQKDMYETKKTRLDIEKLEDEKREKLITPATLEDVKRYDLKYKALKNLIEGDNNVSHLRIEPAEPTSILLLLRLDELRRRRRKRALLLSALALILLAVGAAYYYLR
jgi:hypothetical protein